MVFRNCRHSAFVVIVIYNSEENLMDSDGWGLNCDWCEATLTSIISCWNFEMCEQNSNGTLEI